MSRFVLDNSVTMAWCFTEEATELTEALLSRALEPDRYRCGSSFVAVRSQTAVLLTVPTVLLLSNQNSHNPPMQAVLAPAIRTNQIDAGANVLSMSIHKLVRACGDLPCRMFHKTISRPINGKYHCWQCLKEFEVRW